MSEQTFIEAKARLIDVALEERIGEKESYVKRNFKTDSDLVEEWKLERLNLRRTINLLFLDDSGNMRNRRDSDIHKLDYATKAIFIDFVLSTPHSEYGCSNNLIDVFINDPNWCLSRFELSQQEKLKKEEGIRKEEEIKEAREKEEREKKEGREKEEEIKEEIERERLQVEPESEATDKASGSVITLIMMLAVSVLLNAILGGWKLIQWIF